MQHNIINITQTIVSSRFFSIACKLESELIASYDAVRLQVETHKTEGKDQS